MKKHYLVIVFITLIINFQIYHTSNNKVLSKSYKSKINKKQNYVEVIPEEYDYSKYDIKHYDSYPPRHSDLSLNKGDPKFEVPVTIKNFDEDMFDFQSNEELKNNLLEFEKELYKLLLFINEPKYLKEEDKKSTVNDKYPYAYYNPTREDKLRRAEILKEKIIKIKKLLGMDEQVEFFVKVKKSTFPQKSDDILNHYQESYSIENSLKLFNNTDHVINGNLTDLSTIYKIRKNQITKNVNFQNEKKKLNSLPFSNQILDFIKNQTKF